MASPCYVRGPDDSEARVERVLAMLEMKCGIGGFDFVDAPTDKEQDALLARDDLMDWLGRRSGTKSPGFTRSAG